MGSTGRNNRQKFEHIGLKLTVHACRVKIFGYSWIAIKAYTVTAVC